MKFFLATAATALALAGGATAPAWAEGHSDRKVIRVMVSPGLCPSLKSAVLNWALTAQPYSSMAVPTLPAGVERPGCGSGEKRKVTAGIGESDWFFQSRRLALKECNENRGDLGLCIVAATVLKSK